jgi:hypothetical protein
MREVRSVHKSLVGKAAGERPIGRQDTDGKIILECILGK